MSHHQPLFPLLVWDLPTRLFHWALAFAFCGLVITGTLGSDWLQWHARTAYFLSSLLLFRLVWGVVGGKWSRFANFWPSPMAVRQYLLSFKRGHSRITSPGHNPLGALSIFFVFALLYLQLASGMMSDDEIAFAGPFSGWVSSRTVSLATFYHSAIGKKLLLGWFALHMLAMLFHRWYLHENLLPSMVHGQKSTAIPNPSSVDTGFSRVMALAIWLFCGWLVLRLIQWAEMGPAP